MTVKFMDHTPLQINRLKKEFYAHSKQKVENIDMIRALMSRKETFHWSNMCCSEDDFAVAGGPFFNVYPKVIDALSKTNLSIRPCDTPESLFHKLEVICVKFPIGHEIESKYGVKWFFMSICNGVPEEHPLAKDIAINHRLENCRKILQISYSYGDWCSSWATMWDNAFEVSDKVMVHLNGESEQQSELRRLIARIACGVLLLAADPDYIKPVLLKADEGKTTPIEDRIARAKNRGVFGFTIGEDIERSPHFRRPHFAIRWTGKGGTVPKLVPVKGAIIGKEIMTTVPTGFEQEVSQSLN